VCPCRQWSSPHPRLGTLVRHVMCVVAPAGSGSTALAPAPGPLRVSNAAAPRALVALRGLAPRILTGLVPARPAAVAVAAVAAAAQNDLDAASRTQVQAGVLVHAHPGTTEVLDGLVPARHTDVAPPSSARCRVRYGRQACQSGRPLPRPPSSASTALYRGVSCARPGPALEATPITSPPRRPRLPGRPAGRPGRRTLHPTQTCAPFAVRLNQLDTKTATSPSNRSGS
jgi:hypothetical protein